MACLRSFPDAVRSSAATKLTLTGHLKCARRSLVHAMSSSSVTDAPGSSTTAAYGDSPQRAEGTPTTATSATAGWR